MRSTRFTLIARLVASLAAACMLLAAPAQADIVELHIGQSELDNDDLPEVEKQDGSIYRLSAVNFTEPNAYLRLEIRQDSLEPRFADQTVPATLTGGGSTTTQAPAGRFEATRQLLRLGVGERWGSPGLNLGFELGVAQISLDQSYRNVPVDANEDGANPGTFIVNTENYASDTEETNAYFGMDLSGRYGSFEWRVDATAYLDAPPLNDAMYGADSDQEEWYGANLVWYTDETTAIGFRYEEAAGFNNTSLFLRWSM